MKNQVLSSEQCKELTALGINMSTASMFRTIIKIDSIPDEVIVSKNYALSWKENCPDMKLTPTFTLCDILDILPKTINHNGSKKLRIVPPFTIQYINMIGSGITITRDTLINAGFEMLKYCKQNNYI